MARPPGCRVCGEAREAHPKLDHAWDTPPFGLTRWTCGGCGAVLAPPAGKIADAMKAHAVICAKTRRRSERELIAVELA
jgi:hypothetical protein